MTNVEILLIVLAVIVLSIIFIWLAIPPFVKLAKKKGWNIPAIIQSIYAWLTRLDTLTEVLVRLNIPGAGIFDKIIDIAREAVGYAEQIAKSGQIAPEQRYDEAKKAIYAGLRLAGLSEDKINDPDIQLVIDVGLESAVNALGHKPQV